MHSNKINLGFTTVPIRARQRKLTAKWTSEIEKDLAIFHGINLDHNEEGVLLIKYNQ